MSPSYQINNKLKKDAKTKKNVIEKANVLVLFVCW